MAGLRQIVADDSKRSRLLNAAGEVFADLGFRAATVQMICERAGANVAAVNYYFRDKESLYHETLLYGADTEIYHSKEFQRQILVDPEKALAMFIHDFLRRLLDPMARPQWHTRLVVREMAEPSAGLDVFIEKCIKPRMDNLAKIVRAIVGPPEPNEGCVSEIVNSIVGQCLFYHRCRNVVLKLMGKDDFTVGDINKIAAQIVQFSVGGIHFTTDRGIPVAKTKRNVSRTGR